MTFGNAELKDILFDVKEMPVLYPNPEEYDSASGEFESISQFSHRKVLLRADNNRELGIVGSDWQPILNQTALDRFDEICKESKIKYELGEVLMKDGGAKTSVEIKFPEKTIQTGKGDVIELRGYLHNGFNGSTSVGLELGFFRYWCSNGAIIGSKEHQLKFKHTLSAEDKMANAFKMYIETRFNETEQFIQKLTATNITDAQIKTEFEEQEIIAKKYESNYFESLNKESADMNGAQTLWLMYNIYTRVITHGLEVNNYRKLQLLAQVSNRAKNVWLAK